MTSLTRFNRLCAWAQQAYPKLIHFNKLTNFAAWEQLKLFSERFARASDRCGRVLHERGGDAPCLTIRSSTSTAPIRGGGRSPSTTRRSTCLFPQRSSNWER